IRANSSRRPSSRASLQAVSRLPSVRPTTTALQTAIKHFCPAVAAPSGLAGGGVARERGAAFGTTIFCALVCGPITVPIAPYRPWLRFSSRLGLTLLRHSEQKRELPYVLESERLVQPLCRPILLAGEHSPTTPVIGIDSLRHAATIIGASSERPPHSAS